MFFPPNPVAEGSLAVWRIQRLLGVSLRREAGRRESRRSPWDLYFIAAVTLWEGACEAAVVAVPQGVMRTGWCETVSNANVCFACCRGER